MERVSLILLLLCLLSAAAAALTAEAALVGGWKPIKDLKDPHVIEIAEFAVGEYGRQAHAQLKLDKVLKGETQVVSGVNYRLVLAVKQEEGAGSKRYEAIVWEKPWANFKNLTSFKPAGFMAVLSACSHAGQVDQGLKYFNCMTDDYNINPNQEKYGCVVDLLGRLGILASQRILESEPISVETSVVLSNFWS
ncbi:hypothetical protein Tsubulata_029235, partial [Turnera subulata]